MSGKLLDYGGQRIMDTYRPTGDGRPRNPDLVEDTYVPFSNQMSAGDASRYQRYWLYQDDVFSSSQNLRAAFIQQSEAIRQRFGLPSLNSPQARDRSNIGIADWFVDGDSGSISAISGARIRDVANSETGGRGAFTVGNPSTNNGTFAPYNRLQDVFFNTVAPRHQHTEFKILEELAF